MSIFRKHFSIIQVAIIALAISEKSLKPMEQQLQQQKIASKFNENELKELAEKQGYGYKYGNLVELKKLTQSFNNSGKMLVPVAVPDFFGIPSSNIIAALNSKNFNIKAEWGKVLETITKEEQETTLNTKQIKNDFWEKQKEFIHGLSIAFDRLAADDNPFHLESQETLDFNALLATAAQDYLMVRSTGKEDTRTIANAGGNESVANVKPVLKSIIDAAKIVVCSYFEEKSLKQRIGLGDTTIFDIDIFCPVLIQHMIGEKEGGNIPRCGVMFTEEAEGGISYKNEKNDDGTIKTSGITMIQAALGHNQYVVNSLGPVDTIVSQIIDGEPFFYITIRNKQDRLIQSQDTLIKKENTKQDALTLTLDKKTLITLKYFADALEQYYGYPMDVEFVVRDNTIWIVQARPIVHSEERKKRIPQYISNIATYSQDHIFKGRTIVSLGGSIVQINKQQECIINNKIGAALDEYLAGSRNKKCIFSGKDAPATSHEATTFRGEGKPVLYIPTIDAFRNFFTDTQTVYLSPQQHCALIVNNNNNNNNPIIKEGWIAYPLPRELSVVATYIINKKTKSIKALQTNVVYEEKDLLDDPVTRNPDDQSFDINTLLSQSTQFSPAKSSIKKELPKKSIVELVENEKFYSLTAHSSFRQWLDTLRSEDLKEATGAAKIFPEIFNTRMFQKIKQVTLDENLSRDIRILMSTVRILCNNITWLLKTKSPIINRLVPINYLEALVYQQIPDDPALGYRSFATVGKIAKEESSHDDLLHIDDKNKPFYVQLKKITPMLFAEESKAAWKTLIENLATNGNQDSLALLGSLIKKFNNLGILSLWLNSIVVKGVDRTKNSNKNNYNALVNEFKAHVDEAQNEFNFIKKLKESCARFDVNRFADQHKFQSAWQEFKTNLIPQFNGNDFKKLITNAYDESCTETQKIVAMAAQTLMTKFVDQFDTGIKSMKGSSEWPITKKLEIFKTMLYEYFSLLQKWIYWIPKKERSFLEATNSTIEIYFKLIEEILQYHFDASDLEPSPEVDASLYVIGCGYDFENDRHSPYNNQPCRGEDAYTIIHQSLLNCCTKINSLFGVELLIIHPELLNKIRDNFHEETSKANAKFNFLGMELTDNYRMTLLYNVPLGSHSLQIALRYNAKKQHVTAELRFFGGFAAEAYRWCDCAALATVLQYMKMLKINVNKLDWRTVVITIENITIQDDDHIIGKTYKNLISSAFNTDRDGFYHGAWIFDLPTLTKAEIEKNVLTIKNIATIYTMLKTFKNLGEISFIKIMFWYINTVQPSSAASLMLYSYAIKYSPYFYGECGKISQSFIRKLSPMLQISKDNRELIAFAQQLINSNDSELKNAGIEFLITLCNGKKISPDFINLCQDAVNDVNFEIRTDGINLLIELSKKTEQDDISSPALEMAIALASKIINSTIDKTRTTGIMLFKAICKQKYVPPGLIDLAEQMVRDNNPKIQNLGTNLFVELSNSNRKDIFNSSSLYEEDIQTVISAMADNNNDDNIQNINSIAYNLLIKTVRYSTDIFSNEDSLINQVENIIHNPNKDGIKLLGFFLLSELLYSASKAPKGFFEKIIKYIMNINPELLNKAYQFVKNKITSLGLRYNWLSITEDLMIFIDKPKKYVIDYLFDWFDNNKIIDYQNNLYDPYNDDCAYTVFSIFTDLCKDGIIFNTSIPIAIKALFSQNDILKDSALDFIKALFKHNKGFNELIANKELKDSQPKIYKTICEEAQKYPAGLQAIEENEQKEPQSSIASQ